MRRKLRKSSFQRFRPAPAKVGLCLGGALLALGAGPGAHAQSPEALKSLEKENQELRKRLDTLEAAARKEGTLSSAQPAHSLKALSETTLSGFVTASYFYDTSEPRDNVSNGYLWNSSHNSFSVNKVKVTLASPPAERSGEAWDAAYRVSFIWGEDSSLVNTGGELQGLEALREAYAELNVPLGSGLNVKAGQLISLLNFESGDGGAANPNFSQGYQWFFTGNGPSTGVQLGYVFTDWLDAKVRVQNGLYAGAVDNNDGKTVMGSIGLKPCASTWINLIGFGGEETRTLNVRGGSVLAGHQITEKLNTGFEFDYFNFDGAGPSADLWSAGGWIWYDFTPKLGLAVRGEFLDDQDGGGIKGIGFPGRPGSAITSPDADGDITSVALTLNIRPAPNIKIQPEIRYDQTSYKGGFDGERSRFLIGAGVSYMF